MIGEQLCHLCYLLVIDFWAYVNKSTHRPQGNVILASWLPMVNPWAFYRKDDWEREIVNNDESAGKKGGRQGGGEVEKMILLEMKFETNVDGVIEEIAECGTVDTGTI